MDREIWNYQTWILNRPYPKGIKKQIVIILLFTSLLLVMLVTFKYPVYHTFYGTILEDRKNVVRIMIPIEELEEFSDSLEDNHMKLENVEEEVQIINGKNVMIADVIVSMKNQLLVENNIVIIRVKTKDVSMYEELSKKWKRGMKK